MPTWWRLRAADSGNVVVPHLEVTRNFWNRLIGLQFRSQFASGHGLLLAPCNGIHTFFVRFSIDATFLDQHGCVLQIRRHVPPWRILAPVRNARAVLETPAGDTSWVLGTRFLLESQPDSAPRLPKSLRNWASDSDFK